MIPTESACGFVDISANSPRLLPFLPHFGTSENREGTPRVLCVWQFLPRCLKCPTLSLPKSVLQCQFVAGRKALPQPASDFACTSHTMILRNNLLGLPS
jgi:hypothetical protein